MASVSCTHQVTWINEQNLCIKAHNSLQVTCLVPENHHPLTRPLTLWPCAKVGLYFWQTSLLLFALARNASFNT